MIVNEKKGKHSFPPVCIYKLWLINILLIISWNSVTTAWHKNVWISVMFTDLEMSREINKTTQANIISFIDRHKNKQNWLPHHLKQTRTTKEQHQLLICFTCLFSLHISFLRYSATEHTQKLYKRLKYFNYKQLCYK